tara:strand:+ start:212 stop:694 length:483 start_codon:yes stop_codon:yes gene_type:complete
MAVKSSLLKNFTLEYVLGIVGILILVYALYKYSQDKNILQSGMQNEGPSQPANMNTQEQQNATSAALATSSTESVNDSSALLPHSNNEWESMAPGIGGATEGLEGQSFVRPRVGPTNRNSNLQVRSEPANPRNNIGPWMNSTIVPDEHRRPLEIGTSSLQ